MYRYIFFDLDGTLLDSKKDILAGVRYALSHRGHAVPPESVLDRFIGPPMQDSLIRYCGLEREEALCCVELFRSYSADLSRSGAVLTSGLSEVCRRLRERDFVLAVASSKPQELCDAICRRWGFDYFDAVVGSPRGGDLGKEDILNEVLRRLGLTDTDRPRCLMVGDQPCDVQGAGAVGIDCVGAAFFDYASPDALTAAGALAVVRTAEELERFIADGGPRQATPRTE